MFSSGGLCVSCFVLAAVAVFVYIKVDTVNNEEVKRRQAIWRIECEMGVVEDVTCPVDGGWASWADWSSCTGACDGIGHRRRDRLCSNPTPANDGNPCSGPDQQIEPCYPSNCTVGSFFNIIAGDVHRMQAFRLLQAVPALMERCLQIECPYEAIEAALLSDNTWQLDPESLWNALQCVKRNLGCPEAGEWGPWGLWSACSARCGPGHSWRLRRCDSPPPSNDQLLCEGSPLRAQPCEGYQCAAALLTGDPNVTGNWGEWTRWTNCSETCGEGVKRRRRFCHEKNKPSGIDMWGTHCVGAHDQIEVCRNEKCVLDGGWSGWSAWGPCSKTCGAGRKSRARSCTRPFPCGGGKKCPGLKTEIASCYLSPCKAHSHTVALMNGDSYLEYNLRNKRATLFHFYVRFLVKAPHGTLVRRGSAESPLVRLSLRNWHVCLDTSGRKQSCTVPRICTPFTIDPDVWHSALVTVTNAGMSLRIDDARFPMKETYACDPHYENEPVNIIVGEKLHGAIQELALNFIPLSILPESYRRLTRSDFVPTSASNIVIAKGAVEEAYQLISEGHYMRLPCSGQEHWNLELTVRPSRESGTLLFMGDQSAENWLHMSLQNRRLKLKMVIGDFKSESTGFTECPPDEWLDITLKKKEGANIFEASINDDERITVVLDDVVTPRYRMVDQTQRLRQPSVMDNQSFAAANDHQDKSELLYMCQDEYYIGGLPSELMGRLREDFTPFIGTLASLNVDNSLQDLYQFPVERDLNGMVQVSSKTASVSGSYREISWGNSNRVNLTCLHARSYRSPNTAQWLVLDSSLSGVLTKKRIRSVDDGRVLRLVASADNDLRGFYTCRAHANKRTRNIMTYGVIGKLKLKLIGPDTITIIAIITTLVLVLGTVGWLVLEGSNDIKNGFGFFRDAHLTPEEEADAICKYIDENLHLYASKSVADLAKEKARWRGQQLASESRFGARHPKKFMSAEQNDNDSFLIDEPELPALPEIKGYVVSPVHDVYRCEPCYVSSPQHGSLNTSPRSRLSSSSVELSSPRLLCSRLLLVRRLHSSESLTSRRRKYPFKRNIIKSKARSKLPAIRSSSIVNKSTAYRILKKFEQLKTDDV